MAPIQYRRANCTDGSSSIVTWAEGSQDVRQLPEFFTLDDSNTDQVAAYDSCPWLYRAGGATATVVD